MIVDTFEPPPLVRRARCAASPVALVRACGDAGRRAGPATELRLRGERHTLARDRRAVRHHYDAGNDFFALFLDDSMTYSCAYFAPGRQTLEEAQEAKLELVCTKLALQPGRARARRRLRLGELRHPRRHPARRAGARHHAVRAAGRAGARRAAEAGVADRVEFRVADYRELGGERFDAISSIGMVEHVGEERIDLYAAHAARPAGPGRSPAQPRDREARGLRHHRRGPFSERFVFPDGVPLPLSRIDPRAGAHGLRHHARRGLRRGLRRDADALDRALRVAATTRRCGSPATSARGSGGCTSTPPARGSSTGWASIYQVLAHRP